MFEGNTFLPLHGIPIAYRERKITRLADWLPEPLTVPTRIAKSLIVGAIVACPARAGASSTTDRVDGMMFLANRAAEPRSPTRLTDHFARAGVDIGTDSKTGARPALPSISPTHSGNLSKGDIGHLEILSPRGTRNRSARSNAA